MQQRVDARKTLYDKALGSKLVYLQEDQELVGMKQDVPVQQSRLHEADAAVASLPRRETRPRPNSAARFSPTSQSAERAPRAWRRTS